MLNTQVATSCVEPGSEWRLHRHWYEHSALGDLLNGPVRVIAGDTLYRCLEVLAHKRAFFSFLHERWQTLFQARFDVLLYDLTSTYFESDPPFSGKHQFGYSRDKRSDCVQVVIALVVTPEGFPLAYEVMPGNTSDKTTLAQFLEKIVSQYGRSERVVDHGPGHPERGDVGAMRGGEAPVHYLVGTPKERLTRLEQSFVGLPWREVRESVEVKLLAQDGELYILAQSRARIFKERGMRQRRLRKLWRRLHELRGQSLSRDEQAQRWARPRRKPDVHIIWSTSACPRPARPSPRTPLPSSCAATGYAGPGAARAGISCAPIVTGEDPATLWRYYMQLTEIAAGVQGTQARLGDPPDLPST